METRKLTKNVAQERIGNKLYYLKTNDGYAHSCVYAYRMKAALATGEQVVDLVGNRIGAVENRSPSRTVLNLNNVNW